MNMQKRDRLVGLCGENDKCCNNHPGTDKLNLQRGIHLKKESKLDKPIARLGTSTPVAARIFLICCSTIDKFAEGLGQSVPFIKAGFHMPRVTSADK